MATTHKSPMSHSKSSPMKTLRLLKPANNYDEEIEECGDKSDYSGIVEFRDVYCVKTHRVKTLQIHLYSRFMYQFVGDKKKKVACQDIQSVAKKQDSHQVVVSVKRSFDLTAKQKKYIFDNDNSASKFIKYIKFVNGTGLVVRFAFSQIEEKDSNFATKQSLLCAFKSVDIAVSEADIIAM